MGAAEAIAFELAQVGKPYRFGATGPDAFDCSGLQIKGAQAGGVSIGRTTYEQIFNGSPVSKDALQPGDLVFPDAGHVQMYIGNGQIVEAPHTGAFVRVQQLGRVWAARRIFGPSTVVADAFGVTPVDNPVTSASAVLGNLEKIAGTIDKATFWQRISVGVLGVSLILIAVLFVRRAQLSQDVETGIKVGALL